MIAVDTVVGDRVVRFDRVERLVHWATAVPMLVCAATGFVLYVGPVAAAVGRRDLVRDVHVVAGLVLGVPLLLALAGRWGSGLRRDIERVANWHDDDVRWFRPGRRAATDTGKFNGGQKLNAAFVGASIVVMVATGSIMRWFGPFPLSWRTGATFVHDWIAVGLWLSIAGHLWFALRTRGAMTAITTGWAGADDARARPRWTLRDEPTGEFAPSRR